MNKLKYLVFFISLNVLSVPFFNKDFSAVITETNGKYNKEYKIDYKKEIIKIEVLSPKENKGEIYTYKDDQKYLYYPSIDETIVQSYANEDNDIILALKILKNINKTTKKDGKEYIVKDNKIYHIIGDNYMIDFSYDKDNISEIIFNSSDETRTYKWKY